MGMSRRTKRVLSALAIVAMSLGLFEVAANLLFATNGRIIVPRGRILFLPDDTVSYTLKPNVDMPAANNFVYPGVTVRTNSLGLRDDPPDSWRTKRILIVGDSNTFGFGVNSEQTFVKRLEGVLRISEPEISVINGGVPGYNVWQVCERTRRLVPLVRPDKVIYAAYLNDIEPEYKPHLGGQTVLRLPFYPGEQWTREDAAWVKQWHWFTPVMIRRTADFVLSGGDKPIVKVFRSGRRFGEEAEESGPNQTAVVEQQDIAMIRLARQFDYLSGDDPVVRQKWEQARAEIGRIHQELAALGVGFQLVLLPFRCQIEDPTLSRRLQTELAEYSRKEGIEVVDMTPAMDRHSGEVLYLDRDYHPSPGGHQIIAEAIGDSLR
jgi:lysophospholipase L1-like esterase